MVDLEWEGLTTQDSTMVDFSSYTLAAKRRRKGMLRVCVFAKFWKNYEHWRLKRATGRLEIIQGSKITTGFW